MPETLFAPMPVPCLPVLGEDALYPVRRIFCVGRNYAAHAAEMGFEVDREAPFYFTKSAYALAQSGQSLPYPPATANFHYEMELVVALGAEVFQADHESAAAAVFGYGAGLDMTRRDLQIASREKGRPWSLGKDVENGAVVATITRAAEFGPVDGQRIRLDVNGETRQDATLDDLIWKVDEVVGDLSRFYHLGPGDLIMTGTPAGVGPVLPGDTLEGHIDGLTPVRLKIGAPA